MGRCCDCGGVDEGDDDDVDGGAADDGGGAAALCILAASSSVVLVSQIAISRVVFFTEGVRAVICCAHGARVCRAMSAIRIREHNR